MESCRKYFSIKHAGLWCALLAFCFVSGCYQRVDAGNQATFRFTWWIVALVFCGGILAGFVGFKSVSHSERLGWSLIILGFVCAIIIAPAMYLDYIVVDDAHMEQRTGVMGRKTHDIQFRDLREIKVVSSIDRHGVKNFSLQCSPINGQAADELTGDLLYTAIPEILIRASACGVKISGEDFN